MNLQALVRLQLNRLSPRLLKLLHDVSEKIPDVATSMNLRSVREILKLSSKMKNEFPSRDEMAVIRDSVTAFFSSQLTSEVHFNRRKP